MGQGFIGTESYPITILPEGDKALEKSLLAPRHWFTWMGVGLMRLAGFLPYPWILRLGPPLGRLYARLVPRRREIARINIELCFPDKDEGWRRTLLRRQFDNLGIAFLEVPFAWWASRRRCEERPGGFVRIHGMENLEAARSRGRGVLLLSAHFNSPELSGRLLGRAVPFVAFYRPASNPVMDRVIRRARSQLLELVDRRNVRGAIRALRQGKVVWYAVDQNTARHEAVFVDFFGIPAATHSATARLARLTGAAVVPFHAVRREDGSGYDLYLEPAWENYPSGDLEADTRRVNELVERWVRRTPEQYLWIHRRFKLRPHPDDPSIYPP